jgi:hypothetical protein
MSVRLFHKNARLVLVRRRQEAETTSHRWVSLHWFPHPWGRIFTTALGHLDLAPVEPAPGHLRFALGELRWTGVRCWTTINLTLAHGSRKKRELVASALLRAARYQPM